MFIVTAKFSRRRALLAAVCFLLPALLLFVLLRGSTSKDTALKAASDEDRVAYLQSLGWEASAEPIETLSISLPNPLCEPYLSYNALQLAQGFDLNAYCGKTLRRCSYAITNYPGRASSCQADLYLCNDVIVAGDIVCTGENGFMTGLAFPQKE